MSKFNFNSKLLIWINIETILFSTSVINFLIWTWLILFKVDLSNKSQS